MTSHRFQTRLTVINRLFFFLFIKLIINNKKIVNSVEFYFIRKQKDRGGANAYSFTRKRVHYVVLFNLPNPSNCRGISCWVPPHFLIFNLLTSKRKKERKNKNKDKIKFHEAICQPMHVKITS